MSRTKGHSFERLVAQWFVEAGFPEARRQLEYHVKDALGVDLQGTEPFAIQCKRGRTYAPINDIRQIGLGLSEEEFRRLKGWRESIIPVLITKADQEPAMAVLPAEEFFKLIRQVYK